MKGVKPAALVWGALSVLVLIGGVAAPSQQGKKQPAPQAGTQSNPLYVRELPPELTQSQLDDAKRAEKAASYAANENKIAEAKKRRTDEDLANYTMALFVATTVLALSTMGLLVLGKKQMNDNQAAIKAAQRSAAAAERSVTGLDRPWMIADWMPPRPIYGGEDIWNVSFKFINVGRMPALIKGFKANIVPLDELPAKPEYPSNGEQGVDQELVLLGKDCGTSPIGARAEMIPRDQRIPLVVFGELTYEGLDKTADHHTGVAMLVYGAGGHWEIDRVKLAAYLCRD